MPPKKIGFEIDKSILVPPGMVVRTGYVPVERVRLVCRAPMAIADVAAKYELVKQNAPSALFPAPTGEWEGDTFAILDGRHTYLAYLMLGYTHVLVAWLEAAP